VYNLILAGDIMTTPETIIDIKDKMYDIVKKLDDLNVWNLPVVNDGKYLGFISKANILSHYRDLLIKQTLG
jgi:CIC family chloride channel protein